MWCASAKSCSIEEDKENCPVRAFPKQGDMPRKTTLSCYPGSQSVGESTKDLREMAAFTIVIHRGKQGYGFTVKGSSPAQVGRCEATSSAFAAGLRKDDYIIRINGQNVSRSIADSIAKIVRQSDRQIILDIQRPGLRCNTNKPPVLPRQPLTTVNGQQHHDTMVTASPWQQQARLSPITEKWVADDRSDVSSVLSGSSRGQKRLISPDGSFSDPLSADDSFNESAIFTGRESSVASPPRPATPPHSFQDLSEMDQDRQTAIQKLMTCEEDFIVQMHLGIQRFVIPLRHNIVSPVEHSTLFQTTEKLMAMSEYHLHWLRELSVPFVYSERSSHKYTQSVGSVYVSKVSAISDMYETYCNGIKGAFRLLAELREYNEFERFVKEPQFQDEPTIHRFIQKPLEHIKNLFLSFQRILRLTSLDHQDYAALSRVLDTLRSACNRINECNTRRSRSSLSLVSKSSTSKSPPHSTASHQTALSARSAISQATSIASVDSEVMDVQTRLIFCHHVPAFQLATATRHFIFSGDLMHLGQDQWTHMFVVMMSDLLLLTKVEPDGSLLVVDFPILLHEIVATDFNCAHPGDFELTVETPHSLESVGSRKFRLRTPTMEHKCTWKNILEQRIASCKIQRELVTSGRIADNIV